MILITVILWGFKIDSDNKIKDQAYDFVKLEYIYTGLEFKKKKIQFHNSKKRR